MGARSAATKRGAGQAAKANRKAAELVVISIPPEQLKEVRGQIAKRIPETLLSLFENVESDVLYVSILSKLIEETLPEGSTILQVLVAERAAYYWTVAHAFERGTKKGITEEYKFYVYEFNRNLEILRALAIRNLPAQQVKLLAKKTISVIERIVKNPTERDAILKDIVAEFTIEVQVPGFKSMQATPLALHA